MKVEISTTSDYSQAELNEMINEFKKLGFAASAKTSMIKKSVDVPPDIMFYLAGLAVGAFVVGFFQKMGADTWDLVIEGIMRVFQKKKSVMHSRVIVKIPVSSEDFILCYIVVENDDELKKALLSLPSFIEESGLKNEDVSYFIPIYYDTEEGWHFPRTYTHEKE